MAIQLPTTREDLTYAQNQIQKNIFQITAKTPATQISICLMDLEIIKRKVIDLKKNRTEADSYFLKQCGVLKDRCKRFYKKPITQDNVLTYLEFKDIKAIAEELNERSDTREIAYTSCKFKEINIKIQALIKAYPLLKLRTLTSTELKNLKIHYQLLSSKP